MSLLSVHLNNALYNYIQDQYCVIYAILYVCLYLLQMDCINHILNITKDFNIKDHLVKNKNTKTYLNTIHLVKTKHPKDFLTRTNTIRTYFWNSTDDVFSSK